MNCAAVALSLLLAALLVLCATAYPNPLPAEVDENAPYELSPYWEELAKRGSGGMPIAAPMWFHSGKRAGGPIAAPLWFHTSGRGKKSPPVWFLRNVKGKTHLCARFLHCNYNHF